MGHHPMAQEVDPNPRFLADSLVDESALVMGATAENLHDDLPDATRERCDAYALISQQRTQHAISSGFFASHVVPATVRSPQGWRIVEADEQPRGDTTADALAQLESPFRLGGLVTAGNSAGLNDGAGGVLLASQVAVDQYSLTPRMRLVDYAFVGVEPETMGYGPIPATEKLLGRNDMSIDQVDVIEMNEAFAVQCVAFLDHFGLDLDAAHENPYGGAIALGHPLAFSGARLTMQLAAHFSRSSAQVGLATMCVGLGMGAAVLWERC